jgi:hypothetical protein
MKKFAMLVLTLVLVLLTVAPVAADQPVKSYDVPLQGDYQPLVDCRPEGYDFEIWNHWTATAMVTEFYDRAGNVKIVHSISHGTGDFYRPDRPDQVISGRSTEIAQMEMISSDPPLWKVKYLGPTFDLQLHGEPKLIHVDGTITVLIDAAGNWLEIYKVAGHPRWDIPGLCEYFAG